MKWNSRTYYVGWKYRQSHIDSASTSEEAGECWIQPPISQLPMPSGRLIAGLYVQSLKPRLCEQRMRSNRP